MHKEIAGASLPSGPFPEWSGREPLIGSDVLGKYQITKEIGSGGMAKVYQALDRVNARKVAMKFLNRELLCVPGIRAKFEFEAALIMGLQHPNIVRGIENGDLDGRPYYAMEFLDGVTLDILIGRHGHIDWQVAKGIALQVCDALGKIHGAGVVHRDIKPSNVMVNGGRRMDQAKLIDFGLANVYDIGSDSSIGKPFFDGGRDTLPGNVGTPEYADPEQVGGRGDPGSDVYSLGVMLYQCICGMLPFRSNSRASVIQMHKAVVPANPRALRSDLGIPEAADRLLMKALEKRPVDRFQSIMEMANAIERA